MASSRTSYLSPRRPRKITVTLSDAELDAIKARAQLVRRPVADFVRLLAVGDPIVTRAAELQERQAA